MKPAALWAVTALFNPRHYRSRIANFRQFRLHLDVPLLAVELSFDGAFELAQSDADILIRIHGGDVMWQKERLLNLGVARLPHTCSAVALLDCDIVFERADWVTATLEALQHVPAVQPFSEAHFLARDAGLSPGQTDSAAAIQYAAAHALAKGCDPRQCLGVQPGDGRGQTTGGLAWAYRRELLERHGLYEACVVGGGDTAVTCATYGAFAAVEQRHHMNARQQRFYRRWAAGWFADVAARTESISGNILHLWHGSLIDRQARTRHEGLVPYDFDPAADYSATPEGALCWASEKPALHQYVADFFLSRREDG